MTRLPTTQANRVLAEGRPLPQADDQAALMLVIRIGDRRFAIPAATIVRILPMAALTPLPDAPPGIAGMLAFQGGVLPAVDPRPRLGLPITTARPNQHLIVIAAQNSYLLWVDRAEAIVAIPAPAQGDSQGHADEVLALHLIRVADEYLPILSLTALDPGPLIQPGAARAW